MAEIQGRLAVQAEKDLKACCSGTFKRNYADVTTNVLQDAWHFFFKEKVFKDSVAQANIYSLTLFKMLVMSVHMPTMMNLLSVEANYHGQTCIFIPISSSFVTFNRLWIHLNNTSMLSG